VGCEVDGSFDSGVLQILYGSVAEVGRHLSVFEVDAGHGSEFHELGLSLSEVIPSVEPKTVATKLAYFPLDVLGFF